MFMYQPRHDAVPPVEDPLTVHMRPLGPPIPVIRVTIGVDPRAVRDPARLNDASPYYSTSSEAPRTP